MNNVKIMGILNVTPDSFSDGGKYNDIDKALFWVEDMIKNGADIIDIGGESSRPGSDRISEEEELDRVIPVIEKVVKNFDIEISVDTYKSKVAYEALKLGVKYINDISGFTFDEKIIETIKPFNPDCIIMHMQGTPKNMQESPHYRNVVNEVFDFLKTQKEKLEKNGLKKIIVDPGFGFGKTLEHNYQLLKNLKKFGELDCPVLVGISRKSMIGNVVESKPTERLAGTIALNTIAILNGASIIRVHDVKEAYQSVKVIEKYLKTF